MTDQHDTSDTSSRQDEDEGMGGQKIGNQGGSSSGADWSMGQGNRAADNPGFEQGGSTDNDGGTSGDYTSSDTGKDESGNSDEGNR